MHRREGIIQELFKLLQLFNKNNIFHHEMIRIKNPMQQLFKITYSNTYKN